MMIGFQKIAPRTLKRGDVTVEVTFGYEVRWYIKTPLGSAKYYTQKAALHGLVLRLVLSKEELEFLAQLGLDYAKEELENYEKTMKKVGQNYRKAIQNFLNQEIPRENLQNENLQDDDSFRRIKREFMKQIIYPKLHQILLENKYRCPICGKPLNDGVGLFDHLNMTSSFQKEHREFIKNLMSKITGEIP